ncbi:MULTISPECIES: fumarylacetoacetase [Asticcacaulis]|uniref:fumarylacetoacetase n=1 Tax=Asticcacaulis TaxID=76890 RepID=UPI001AE36515|nr:MULTISPECIES: fumarylacetoacetase [Asticcacaulis]MBP2161549.1 fumarylacetoacetase [Asticcacaulis solisilvae]MDR6802600.1 fumarylacetoacetase [Asticcacaulis sp. BE141]
MIDATHDIALESWVHSANGHHDFPIQNLPFGLFSPAGEAPRPGVAIGDHILELQALVAAGMLRDVPDDLETILATPPLRKSLRHQLSRLLSDATHSAAAEPYLHTARDCVVHLPVRVGDYTDFYVGIHHATKVGALFRPDNPLLPNYKHVPIGYHGRASSVRVSGEPVVRPRGQTKAQDAETPGFGPSRRLDFELELGVWVGPGNALGDPIAIADAPQHIGGFCLLNDWSARDFQAWEYQPLGPFLAKNFHTTVSAWIVTPEALAPFRMAPTPRPMGDPRPLPYLWAEDDQAYGGLSINLEVSLRTAKMRAQNLAPVVISRSHTRHMYWTVAQILTHHASNGCNLQPGDLLGTGTLSGPDSASSGSLLELSDGGKSPIILPGNETRTFLEDGDEIILSARAAADGFAPIGFGDCRATILAARG